ncbi:MAG: LysR family transcriptional regulator [Oscillospiraceae bacterium]|jgi:LysR family transcriptional activator of glutamate synthase operon
MELNQLYCFRAVARKGSVTEAAKELYTSQSALSRVISRLESEVGVKLFDRRPGKIELNEAGSVFLEHVEAALDSLEKGVTALADFAPSRDITVYSLLSIDILENIAEKCQAEFPSLSFDFRDLSPEEQSNLQEETPPDIVLAPAKVFIGLEYTHRFTEKWCVILNCKYPLPYENKISLEQLSKVPITLIDYPSDRAFAVDVFSKAGLTPNVVYARDSKESGTLVNRCKCVGFAPVGVYRDIKMNIADFPVKALQIEGADCSRDIYLGRNTRRSFTEEELSALNYIEAEIISEMRAIQGFTAKFYSQR